MHKQDLQTLHDKVVVMLPNWKAIMLTKGGRLVLTKMVMSPIPLPYAVTCDIAMAGQSNRQVS
jgi:hypothetical protein